MRDRELGRGYRPPGFLGCHSRITAYAAVLRQDEELAAQAADELLAPDFGEGGTPVLETVRVVGPDVLQPVDEATWVSTNATAQWGLATIQASALVPRALEAHR